jgi:CIC family chloride channel protein
VRPQHEPSGMRFWPVVLVAAVVGLLAAAVGLAFRWLIETSQGLFLPGHGIGNYEGLDPLIRFLLPVGGALLLGAAFSRLPQENRSVGIAHVLDRLGREGRTNLPVSNAVVQFLAGALAIVSGQSVDREGPGVHLGAAVGNRIAQRYWLTQDEVRTLTLAGAAASIAAAFNTRLAGVMFALEVLYARYEVTRFMAIILAAVIGAVAGRLVYGPDPAFMVPPLNLESHWELILIAVMGLMIGVLSSTLIASCTWFAGRTATWSRWQAFAVAGLCTGALGVFTPQILGVSYDTLTALLRGEMALAALAMLVAFKLIATSVSIGVGMPGGLIGPTLVIGGALGALMGQLVGTLGLGEWGQCRSTPWSA